VVVGDLDTEVTRGLHRVRDLRALHIRPTSRPN
jgi:hypothetical protein